MKGKYRNHFDVGGLLDPHVPVTYNQHLVFIGVFAESLSAEASELSLDHRTFSPNAFTQFAYGGLAIEDGVASLEDG